MTIAPTYTSFSREMARINRGNTSVSVSSVSYSPSVSSPVNIELKGMIEPGWVITQPLPVRLEQDENGVYYMSDDIFAVYGLGDTPQQAFRDYVLSLVDYYDLLERENDLPTVALFDLLRKHLQPMQIWR